MEVCFSGLSVHVRSGFFSADILVLIYVTVFLQRNTFFQKLSKIFVCDFVKKFEDSDKNYNLGPRMRVRMAMGRMTRRRLAGLDKLSAPLHQ